MVAPRSLILATHRLRRFSYFATDKARCFATSSLSSYEQAIQNLPDGAQIHLDFFGEPISFFGVESGGNIENTVAALDRFEIGLATRGKAFTGGGEEFGVSIQAAHSAALAWSDILRHATVWNSNHRSSPMLAHIAVSPLLVQTGVQYVKDIDDLLSQVPSGVDGVPPLQMLPLAKLAADQRRNQDLDARERTHLNVLDCLLRHQHKRALAILGKHLQRCPGDCLALSLLMDLAHVVGDRQAASIGAGAVAAYWNERQGSMLKPSIPGYNAASSLIALGMAVGGRHETAEQLALKTMHKGEKLAGGTASWTLALCFDAEGRTAEGISALSNSEGITNYEDCGLLFFDSILSGYGVRFSVDREERGRGKSSALRLYDNAYERVLDYNLFARQGDRNQIRKAPVGWQKSSFKTNKSVSQSFVSNVFPSSSESKDTDGDQSDTSIAARPSSSLKLHEWEPSCEDVLTWMPPTPQFLSDATLLLFRLTLNGTISVENYRWDNLKTAWSLFLDNDAPSETEDLRFYPLASIAASLLVPEERAGTLPGAAGRLARAMNKIGVLLNLGEASSVSSDDREASDETSISKLLFVDLVADSSPDFWLPSKDADDTKEWKEVLRLLSSVIDGVLEQEGDDDMLNAELLDSFETWDFDARPFIEHATVYAACKCGDYDSLSLARSICSRGVSLRPQNPEEWWRYSIVLGLLGDEVASEDALNASFSFGGGQGVRHE